MNPQKILTSESKSKQYATKDSLAWIAEVDWVFLCLVETFDVRWDKTFKGKRLLRIIKGEKKCCTIRTNQT